MAIIGAESSHSQERPPRFELTLQAGYRIGGEFGDDVDAAPTYELEESNSQRVMFDVAAGKDTQWEALYGRQRTTLETDELFAGQPLLDIDVDYVHFGGTYLFDGGDVSPFVVLTAGIARFDPRGSDLDAETYLSGSIGGGVQLRSSKRIGVRLEARAFASLVDSDGGLFCRSGGVESFCAISIEADSVIQWEGGIGVVYRF